MPEVCGVVPFCDPEPRVLPPGLLLPLLPLEEEKDDDDEEDKELDASCSGDGVFAVGAGTAELPEPLRELELLEGVGVRVVGVGVSTSEDPEPEPLGVVVVEHANSASISVCSTTVLPVFASTTVQSPNALLLVAVAKLVHVAQIFVVCAVVNGASTVNPTCVLQLSRRASTSDESASEHSDADVGANTLVADANAKRKSVVTAFISVEAMSLYLSAGSGRLVQASKAVDELLPVASTWRWKWVRWENESRRFMHLCMKRKPLYFSFH